LNTDMCKFESSQKDESKAHAADSSKAYSKLKAFNSIKLYYWMLLFLACA